MNYFTIFLMLLAAAAIGVFSAETPEVSNGERLAKTVCASCHLFPEPALLPKATWEQIVLPQMGYQLGIYPKDSLRLRLIGHGPESDMIRQAGLFPAEPLLTPAQWAQIGHYYKKYAPDTLAGHTRTEIQIGIPHFRTRLPDWQLSPPSTTMIRFQPAGGLWLGDANSRRLYWADDSLRLVKAANLAEGVVDIQERPEGLMVTLMGSFSPTDAPNGAVIFMNAHLPQAQILLENLQRPVHSVWDDFNQDGKIDAVVCEYAKWTGGLNYYEQQADGTFSKTALRKRPGAIRSYVRDFNKDGLLDLIALFGQGDEGIFRYINLGNGRFKEEAILRFPPTFGSSSFRLADVNGDGLEDIVHTCGDNADYRPVLKPYHGVRIFTATGTGGYAETYFMPLHGAYDAIFKDFDADGDLDLAAISFFPDYLNAPQAAFQYLENTGNFNFLSYTFPEVGLGRWMVMDVGDLEGDGDLDIALGPLTFEVAPDRGEVQRWVAGKLPFVVLENTVMQK